MAEPQQAAPDRLDINGNPVAPDRLDAQGNPVYERPPDFKAQAEIPTMADFEAAKTPNQKMALLKSLPLPNDTQIVQTVKDLFHKWVAYGPHAVVQGIKDAMNGEISKGAHEVISGAGMTAAPMLAPGLLSVASAAPIATGIAAGAGLAGGYAGQQVGERGATALGATPDQATLAGDVGGLLGGAGAVKGVTARSSVRAPAPPIQFAAQRGIPLDAATVTDNLALKGVQSLVERGTLGGAAVATPAKARQLERMTAVGDELAAEAHPAMTTPEQAGLSVKQALENKVAGHTSAANDAYESIRQAEQQSANRMAMPLKPQAVDALSDGERGQLRRIVHEMDAAPYTPRLLKPSGVGSTLEHVDGTGGAGAKVFDDIVQRMPGTSTPTRGVVQNQIETYLAGGPETPAVKAAREVAQARGRAQGGTVVSKPELPPSAMDVPTRLEASRVNSEEMGLPVDLSGPKAALRPLYEQMRRQMPITQQQANPGLKAIENILTGPDYGPLSQVDRDLSTIKSLAREHGGLAKVAVTKLEAAVTEAAKNGGPEVWNALQTGRAHTVSKYATTDVLETLNSEPVKAIASLTAPKDSAIQKLRAVTQQVPQQAPVIARGYLEDLLEKPNKVAEWSKLGTETKKILFPKPGLSEALDNFFALTDRISKTNVNPSGSGYMVMLGQSLMLVTNPLSPQGVPLQIGAATVAKLLRSPAVIAALTRGMLTPAAAPSAVRTAAFLNILKQADAAGVPLSPTGTGGQ